MLIMIPIAVLSGEVWTTREEHIGFLDRPDLHTPLYLWLNVFAGEKPVVLACLLDILRWVSLEFTWDTR